MLTSSILMIASVPLGAVAPVMISMAPSVFLIAFAGSPAYRMPSIFQVGALMSFTAIPSIMTRSKGGKSRSAIIFSAKFMPKVFAKGNFSVRKGMVMFFKRAIASIGLIMFVVLRIC